MAVPGGAGWTEGTRGQLALGLVVLALDRSQPMEVKREIFQMPTSFFPVYKVTRFK